ncbi:hypothetical protein ABID21_000180 [Pseudorhizobium tarimense]|uniref:Uncharacterized protein n=1 Tax=Pseudorhizobium tarimense TaxID=1079109 RepID=A0ABV2H0N2_9HYPH|nr:hypothetical protein [Pseudorhizobium tarimense]MCJ8517421.1 hypothetical protein [Pseudorhizobium tarimense]
MRKARGRVAIAPASVSSGSAILPRYGSPSAWDQQHHRRRHDDKGKERKKYVPIHGLLLHARNPRIVENLLKNKKFRESRRAVAETRKKEIRRAS